MTHIKKIEISEDETGERGFEITLGNGEAVMLSFADAGIIKEQMLLDELRCGIRNIVDNEIEGGYIDFSRGDITREDFEDEIYKDFEDDISCGDYSALSDDGDDIRERATDLAAGYGLFIDD